MELLNYKERRDFHKDETPYQKMIRAFYDYQIKILIEEVDANLFDAIYNKTKQEATK